MLEPNFSYQTFKVPKVHESLLFTMTNIFLKISQQYCNSTNMFVENFENAVLRTTLLQILSLALNSNLQKILGCFIALRLRIFRYMEKFKQSFYSITDFFHTISVDQRINHWIQVYWKKRWKMRWKKRCHKMTLELFFDFRWWQQQGSK